MKTLLFVGGSRAGNEFFLSLLDHHSQILQFPGTIRGDLNLLNILTCSNPEKIVKDFIYQYKHFFNSKKSNDIDLTKLERHDELGDSKKKYFVVDENKFKSYFIKVYKNKSNQKNRQFYNLLLLHQAYSIAKGKNLKRMKLMVINCHLIPYVNFFVKNILKEKKFNIIHTIRHPLSAISSPLNNWIKYNSGKFFFSDSMYYQIDLVVNGIKKLKKINKRVFIIKLESMHLKNSKVLKEFCQFYNLKIEKCLKKSTINNLKWWGDKISNKNLNGINKNFKVKYEKNNFYRKDIEFFSNLLNKFSKKYDYTFLNKNSNFIFNFMPFKCELITWKNTLKNGSIKNAIQIPYYFIKRIINVNFSLQNNIKFPDSFGELNLKEFKTKKK